MTLNKVMLLGNLGRDPELRYTPTGQAVTTFSLAVNRRWKDKEGNWQNDTEWFNCQTWGPLAERVAENQRKGSRVYCEGRLQTQKWESSGKQKTQTVIVCSSVLGLDKRQVGEKPADDGKGEPAEEYEYPDYG